MLVNTGKVQFMCLHFKDKSYEIILKIKTRKYDKVGCSVVNESIIMSQIYHYQFIAPFNVLID